MTPHQKETKKEKEKEKKKKDKTKKSSGKLVVEEEQVKSLKCGFRLNKKQKK